MADPLRVGFAVSECVPFVKTGGLADVAGALPGALRSSGVDVRLILPGYGTVLDAIERVHAESAFTGPGALGDGRLIEATLRAGMHAYVVDHPGYYQRPGGPYQDEGGRDWPDNALRFGLFSYAAALLGAQHDPFAARCDVIHCHDWQAALAPAYLSWSLPARSSTILTIHNLAYQGVFPPHSASRVGLPAASFTMHGVEYYGNLSFLKAGLQHADRITTVSPTYAREIQSEVLGFGLQGLLAARGDVLDGILNGIDTALWNPAEDGHIAARYDADNLADKCINTRALRERVGLDARPEQPLLGVVSRLIPQKGLDLLADVAARVTQLPAQLVVVGTGERDLEEAWRTLAAGHPGRIAFVRGFDETLSHQIEAGADIFVMPSRFEPCGLNQMYSLRYGTPPIVRRTGGLADSVVDTNTRTLTDGTATGFVFDSSDAQVLFATIERAVRHWQDKAAWRMIQRNGMARDCSWAHAARAYARIYQLSMQQRR